MKVKVKFLIDWKGHKAGETYEAKESNMPYLTKNGIVEAVKSKPKVEAAVVEPKVEAKSEPKAETTEATPKPKFQRRKSRGK